MSILLWMTFTEHMYDFNLRQEQPSVLLKGFDGLADGEAAPRLRRAEAVLQSRTQRICVVLETTCDARNETAGQSFFPNLAS